MTSDALEEPGRLPSPGGAHPLLRGALGRALLRPPFDWFAVRAVARVYLRLSRGWAAALDCGDDLEGFLRETGVARQGAALRRAIAATQAKGAAYDAARSLWEQALFPGAAQELGPQGGPEAGSELARIEHARQAAAHDMMAARIAFLPFRGGLRPAAWEVAGEAEVEARHGARLADPERAFPCPAQPEIEVSRAAPGQYGPERWLRYRSPVLGDRAWAHVFDLASDRPDLGAAPGAGRPTAIFLHGIGMETEMWRGAPGLVPALAERGFRVILAEGPWHGRRRPSGRYGGEPILARGPLGLLDLLEAWAAEVAVLLRWARETGGGPVVLSGVSLGALTAQRAACASLRWPAAARPDALMLVATSGTLIDLAGTGSLARQTGLARKIHEAGWSARDLRRWLPLMEPDSEPPLAPERILMVLGARDDLTPFPGGQALADSWRLPPENLILRPQGHFSVSLGVLSEPGPLDRLREIVGTL